MSRYFSDNFYHFIELFSRNLRLNGALCLILFETVYTLQLLVYGLLISNA